MKIRVRGFSTWYEEKNVLKDVSLDIYDNSVTAIIGPSGCGKSTLLKSINRMTSIIPIFRYEGDIVYKNKSIYDESVDVTKLRREIGLVFQKPNPLPFSIFDNVAFGPRMQGVASSSSLKRTVRESLVKADLWDEVKDRLLDSALRLSGGQQQRLCIARALAVKPSVLLLDESTSSLDPIATRKIEKLLSRLQKHTALVVVTHSLAQAKRISDYTAYLLDGKLVEFGETKQVFSKPENKLTKDYIDGRYG